MNLTVWVHREEGRIFHTARPVQGPKEYRFLDDLATNNYGKVLERELGDRLRVEAEGNGSGSLAGLALASVER